MVFSVIKRTGSADLKNIYLSDFRIFSLILTQVSDIFIELNSLSYMCKKHTFLSSCIPVIIQLWYWRWGWMGWCFYELMWAMESRI